MGANSTGRRRPLMICVDFDGVLHSYTSGFKGHDRIPDPPVPGALEWLRAMVLFGDFEIAVFSSRSCAPAGVAAMRNWLIEHGLPREIVEQIRFPTDKPPAWLSIDDRAIPFRGRFPSREEMIAFKPWKVGEPAETVLRMTPAGPEVVPSVPLAAGNGPRSA